MVPTIMVARIALASSTAVKEPVTAHISDLEFGGARSTGFNQTGRATVELTHIHVIDVNSLPSGQDTEKTEPQVSP